MKIYRVMNRTEMEKTVKNKKPDFLKRHKWFSSDLKFIINRVCDKKFNNSNFITDRYEYILEFEWDGKKADWETDKEIQFDRRKNPNIIFEGCVNND